MLKKINNKIILIAIAFLTLALVYQGTLAIFKNSRSGSASLRASIWNVSLNQSGINNTINLESGVTTDNYIVKVDSNSEVDVIYSIVVRNIPNGVEVSIDNGEFQTPSSGTVTFSNVGTILYSSVVKENTHTLTFSSMAGTTPVNNQTVTVDVIAEQVM